MRFIVDAQLPSRLARDLCAAGHDARHTLELPLGNRTPDGQLAALAASEDRVLITKSSNKVRVVSPPSMTYYEILRSKLRWSER